MTAHSENTRGNGLVLVNLQDIARYLLRPVSLLQAYDRLNLRPDFIAGLTVGVILLPQAIAYALIAELPPQVGLYTAIIAAIVGALWGSSNHLQTGPTNAVSLLVLSSLLTIAAPGTIEFMVAAGLMAVMVGVFQAVMGLARLGVLVNFVSHSVVVGFSAGAGVLIAVKQLPYLFGLQYPNHGLLETAHVLLIHLPETDTATLVLGLGAILLIVVLYKFSPKLPGPLIGMIIAAVMVWFLSLDQQGVTVIGELPQGLPPFAELPFFNLELVSQLAMGALAVAAIGLVEAMSIARSIATQTDQRLESNQEFVGQGLANIAAGLFSGYPCSGSFTRSAVSYKAGARTPLSSVFSGLFVLLGMLALAPLAAYLPRAALAGVLMVTAYSMIDRAEIKRIWYGARGDAMIMVVTFLGTLFLDLAFAVLAGILLSFALYIMKTSVPQVSTVVPDEEFKHFVDHQPGRPFCPQLGILRISGDLYFGAVSHIEETIHKHLSQHPEQRFLLLRMQGVNQCDFSGIHMLESVMRLCRDRNGDLFLMKVQEPVRLFMQATGFYDRLGSDHVLMEDYVIGYLFQKILDPAICIYECPVRVFKECQNLPKQTYPQDISLPDIPPDTIPDITPQDLWQKLYNGHHPSPLVIDVREPREFKRGHIPQAQLVPLPKILMEPPDFPHDRDIVMVCRGGRRSTRATYLLQDQGYQKVRVLRGGMLAWEAAGLLEAIE
ncbi:MAG: sulfate permease [Anaerolineae bacterium]|nr:sulfate permease [Anaerolineae bacterium]